MSGKSFILRQDRKGMIWDLLLYVPTVVALFSISATLWFDGNVNLSYLLLFLGTFFFIVAVNRVFKTRLMVFPSAPVVIEVNNKDSVCLTLRNGGRLSLERNLRFYPDYSGRSFGLAGLDKLGHQKQFVFHKGQFLSEQEYQDILKIFRGA